MSFASLAFILFAAVFFCGWPLARRRLTSRFVYLIVLSLFFYGYAHPVYVPLFLLNSAVSFACARGIARVRQHAKALLILGVATDLSVLVVFKYAAFLARNINLLLDATTIGYRMPLLDLPLPIGVSFYTFMSISYLVDVYRRHTQPAENALHYAAYLSMFPHLVAGPIVRAHDLLPQLLAPEVRARVWPGLVLMIRGFFKKLVIADNLAPAVTSAFAAGQPAGSAAYWWVVASMFGLQIYFDFSGYTDIARGLARWLGFEFKLNFNHPYSAMSFRDFWARWHMSLSQWFRDYVYVPLGGSRRGRLLELRNLWIAMVVSGLWHGANWTYVVWGASHAFLLTLERLTQWPERLGNSPLAGVFRTVMVFALATLTWVFFRAGSLSQATEIIGIMLSAPADFAAVRYVGVPQLGFWALGLAVCANHRFALLPRILTAAPRLAAAEPVAYGVIAALSLYWRGPTGAFIYFQF